jgi:hypothetical protein
MSLAGAVNAQLPQRAVPGVVGFPRSQASGSMYLDGLTHVHLPPRVDTNMILSREEDRALFALFNFKTLFIGTVPGTVVADRSAKLIAVYQHCCSIQQISISRYAGSLPRGIAVERFPAITFAGFAIGSRFADVTNMFGVPLKKSMDGSIWYYDGPRPGTTQTCGREWQLKFVAKKLYAVTVSEGC